MQKIIPHLCFDRQAVEAAEFYTQVFPEAKINFKNVIKDTPSGDTEIVGFEILGYQFMAISAGPLFKLNPSISFHVKCKTVEEVDAIWAKLSPGGQVMMELNEYPFSKRYGWVADKFGVSWQIIYAEGEFTQRIVPVLMFTQEHAGQTKEAVELYTSIFSAKGGDSKVVFLSPYEEGESPVDKPGTIKYGHFILEGQEFGAMDSAQRHAFTFNEAVSLMVNCKDQAEIDFLWEKLSAVPAAEQCGWLKDKFGVSWQITPANMSELIGKNPAKVMPLMLKMKKIDIAALQVAGDGK